MNVESTRIPRFLGFYSKVSNCTFADANKKQHIRYILQASAMQSSYLQMSSTLQKSKKNWEMQSYKSVRIQCLFYHLYP